MPSVTLKPFSEGTQSAVRGWIGRVAGCVPERRFGEALDTYGTRGASVRTRNQTHTNIESSETTIPSAA